MALLAGRPVSTSEDVHRVAVPALRHRVLLRYHAEAEGMKADEIVLRVLESLPDGLYRRPAPETAPVEPKGLLRRLLGGSRR